MEVAVSCEEGCTSLVIASENVVVVVEVELEVTSGVGIADWVSVA